MFVDELLKYENMNVIFVEWAAGAMFPYHQAYGNARLVGKFKFFFLKKSGRCKISFQDTGRKKSALSFS